MVYGVRVAETRLEQNLMHLTYVLNYYRLYQDRSTKQLEYKTQWANSPDNTDMLDPYSHLEK
jgi:hypothetical protein